MKRSIKFSLSGVVLALLAVILIGCKDIKPVIPEPGEPPVMLEAVLVPYYNGEPFVLDEVLTTVQGYPIRIRELKFYLTKLTNNDKTLVNAAKLDWATHGLSIFKSPGNPEDFSNISGFLGVVEEWNHLDPVSFETTNPLYLTNANDMHWSWNPGYIFVKVEGSHDTIPGTTTFPFNFSFHLGMDDNLKTINWTDVVWTKIDEKLYRMTIKINMETFFNGPGGNIDLKTEYVTHSMPSSAALTEKAITNFQNAIQVN